MRFSHDYYHCSPRSRAINYMEKYKQFVVHYGTIIPVMTCRGDATSEINSVIWPAMSCNEGKAALAFDGIPSPEECS